MDKEGLDDLLNTLSFIALNKFMLPFNLRGWVNALGLHVQERKAGQWTRLQAGGSFRSYLDAWRQEEGEYQVKKFDQETWEQRFSYLVGPTYNIADYLLKSLDTNGNLDRDKGAILNNTFEHFKSTKEWLWLSGVATDLALVSMQISQLEPARLDRFIDSAERLREGSKEPFDWQFLALLYDTTGRYKDMEKALKTAYELVCSGFRGAVWMAWRWRHTLGKFYYAAYCNSGGGQDVVVLGSNLSKVTAQSLGYTVDEVRILAQETLKGTYEDAKQGKTEQDSPELMKIEQTIRACSNQ